MKTSKKLNDLFAQLISVDLDGDEIASVLEQSQLSLSDSDFLGHKDIIQFTNQALKLHSKYPDLYFIAGETNMINFYCYFTLSMKDIIKILKQAIAKCKKLNDNNYYKIKRIKELEAELEQLRKL